MSCPTLTQFTTLTTSSVLTTFIDTVSTDPPTTSTSTSVSCLLGVLNLTCTTSTFVTVIPGHSTTIQVPTTVNVPVVVTQPVQTLFAPCTSPPPSSSSSSDPTTSFIISQTTPPPTVFTSHSSFTMPDGSVTFKLETITSSLSPSVVYVPTALPTNQSGSPGQNRMASIAPIVGGVVGGFFGLIIIVAIIWFLLRRRRTWGDIFEGEDPYQSAPPRITNRKPRFDMDLDAEPKPYQYGLVGQVNSPSPNSPPASPTLGQHPLNNNGNDTNGITIAASLHAQQRSSLTPLMVPTSAVSTPGQSTHTSSSRPSTAGSAFPLRPPSSRSTADEFGARPTSVQSHHQLGGSSGSGSNSWNRQSPPLLPVNWSSIAAASPPLDDTRGQDRSGSPVSLEEPRRPLQIVNNPPSPTISLADDPSSPPQSPEGRRRASRPVIVHQDGGVIDPNVIITAPADPPSYQA